LARERAKKKHGVFHRRDVAVAMPVEAFTKEDPAVFIVAAPKTTTTTTTKSISRLRRLLLPQCRKLRKLHREFTNPTGRMYAVFMVLREIFECAIQFAGLQEMSDRADVGLVHARASLLSANLIVLPVFVWAANRIGGRFFARATLQITEKLFDKAFVVTGVLFQISAGEDVASVAVESSSMALFAFHAPVLFPAFVFILNPTSSMASLMTHSERLATERRTAAAKTLQQFARQRVLRATRIGCERERSGWAWDFVAMQMRQGTLWGTSRLRLEDDEKGGEEFGKEGKEASEQRSTHLLRMTLMEKVRERLRDKLRETKHGPRRVFRVTAAVASFVAGVVLLAVVTTSIRAQSARCAAVLGDVAQYLRPRVFFGEQGVYGPTQCGFAYATKLAAQGTGLTSRNLPSAQSAYEAMVKLKSIDVSHNPDFESAPPSWGAIPHLESVSFSGNTRFRGLPFSLCAAASSSVTTLSLDGTVAEKKVDWSRGKLFEFQQSAGTEKETKKDQNNHNNNTGATAAPPRLSAACAGALRSTLLLDLSGNGLTCPDYALEYIRPEASTNFLLYDGDGRLHRKTSSSGGDSSGGGPAACQFAALIEPLRKLRALNLSHNALRSLQTEFFSVTKFITLNANASATSGIALAGNPVEVVHIGAQPADFVERWLETLGRGGVRLRALQLSHIDGLLHTTLDTLQAFPGLREVEVLSLRSIDSQYTYAGIGRLESLRTLWISYIVDDVLKNPELTGFALKGWILPSVEHGLFYSVPFDPNNTVVFTSAANFPEGSRLLTLEIPCESITPKGGVAAAGVFERLNRTLARLIIHNRDNSGLQCGSNTLAHLGLSNKTTKLEERSWLVREDAPSSY
jgi:hypothetical protein